jgi:hypothetical protein
VAQPIEGNLGIDVGITPTLMDHCPIRNHEDNDGIWAESVRIIRTKLLDGDLHVHEYGSGYINASSNMSYRNL